MDSTPKDGYKPPKKPHELTPRAVMTSLPPRTEQQRLHTAAEQFFGTPTQALAEKFTAFCAWEEMAQTASKNEQKIRLSEISLEWDAIGEALYSKETTPLNEAEKNKLYKKIITHRRKILAIAIRHSPSLQILINCLEKKKDAKAAIQTPLTDKRREKLLKATQQQLDLLKKGKKPTYTSVLEKALMDIASANLLFPQLRNRMAQTLPADKKIYRAFCIHEKKLKKLEDKLAKSHAKFAVSLIPKKVRNDTDLANTIYLEIIDGIVNASTKFDPRSGYSFITYARYWGMRKYYRALEKAFQTVHLPKRMVKTIGALTKAKEECLKRNLPQTTHILSALSDLPEKAIEECILYLCKGFSLNATLTGQTPTEEDDRTLESILGADTETPERKLEQKEDGLGVQRVLKNLPESQREAVTLVHLEGHKPSVAAAIMRLTPTQFSTLLAHASQRLRTPTTYRTLKNHSCG
ncbi:MAG: sigma-70 family RNA polymerase sigma factor [Bdellovibrionales bacterium]